MFDFFMSAITALNDNVLWGVPMVVLMLRRARGCCFIGYPPPDILSVSSLHSA